MKKHVLRVGFLIFAGLMLMAFTGCESAKTSGSSKKGIAVKVKASKF